MAFNLRLVRSKAPRFSQRLVSWRENGEREGKRNQIVYVVFGKDGRFWEMSPFQKRFLSRFWDLKFIRLKSFCGIQMHNYIITTNFNQHSTRIQQRLGWTNSYHLASRFLLAESICKGSKMILILWVWSAGGSRNLRKIWRNMGVSMFPKIGVKPPKWMVYKGKPY